MTEEQAFEILRNDVIVKLEAYNAAIAKLTLKQLLQIEIYEETAGLRTLFSESSTRLMAFVLELVKA